ncbi:low molecular weight protein arginine phosphatase [Macrococcus hajekii]|uniref:Low molecular weight protein-tyrosine-phosphatase PtpB n=1 Tax=Macrococcus hajekii TaxID=198482 RepID=A0A4R6BHX8_9STAP|nr:low molecular weight protein arginine phosphatase [Macrococcus hajekii]TDM01114.1 low molecular weight protein arginine phosphatase [Macrococcus hajekii]GGB12319.1 low molecular weight protein-tyrosine-phosphatase PtpB [Macrococcus hajekii]
MNIIFVCTGNTCRSPLAESLAKARIENHSFESRGISAFEGAPISVHSAQLLQQHHLPPAGHARLFTEQDAQADLILTMSESHKYFIQRHFQAANVYTLAEYASHSARSIADPYGGSLADYEQTFTEIRNHIDNLAEKLNDF